MKKQDVKYDNKYLSVVAKGIRNKRQKKNLCDELESHILDKADYYEEIGYTREEAMEKATEDMGNPNEVVISMNKLHYSDWYEDPLSFDSIILLTLQTILLFFLSKHLIYSQYGAVHYIYKDFISLLILGFNLYVIYRARKEKNKHVLVFESISLIFQLFFNPYQPLFYGVASSFDDYASNYTDYIFSYRFISDQTFDTIKTASIVLVSIMICYCIFTVVLIHLQEKGKKVITQWQITKAVGITALMLFVANFTFMTTSTLVAYTQKDVKAEESRNLKLELLNYFQDFKTVGKKPKIIRQELFQNDESKKYSTLNFFCEEMFFTHNNKNLGENGSLFDIIFRDAIDTFYYRYYDDYEINWKELSYNGYDDCNEWHYYIGDSVVILTVYDWFERPNTVSISIENSRSYILGQRLYHRDFYKNGSESILTSLNKNTLYCHEEEFEFMRRKMTLDEFLTNDLYTKALEFAVDEDYIYFTFKMDNGYIKGLEFSKNIKLNDIDTFNPNDDADHPPW